MKTTILIITLIIISFNSFSSDLIRLREVFPANVTESQSHKVRVAIKSCKMSTNDAFEFNWSFAQGNVKIGLKDLKKCK